MKNKWYESITGNHQGLIIEENTGDNIAVTYKKEHAPIIVKAVNCHDELVAALKEILEYDETTPIRKPYTMEKYKPLTNLLRQKAKQALTKASA